MIDTLAGNRGLKIRGASGGGSSIAEEFIKYAVEPTGENASIYYNTVNNQFYGYRGGSFLPFLMGQDAILNQSTEYQQANYKIAGTATIRGSIVQESIDANVKCQLKPGSWYSLDLLINSGNFVNLEKDGVTANANLMLIAKTPGNNFFALQYHNGHNYYPNLGNITGYSFGCNYYQNDGILYQGAQQEFASGLIFDNKAANPYAIIAHMTGDLIPLAIKKTGALHLPLLAAPAGTTKALHINDQGQIITV